VTEFPWSDVLQSVCEDRFSVGSKVWARFGLGARTRLLPALNFTESLGRWRMFVEYMKFCSTHFSGSSVSQFRAAPASVFRVEGALLNGSWTVERDSICARARYIIGQSR
jgi:hypothetical protein